MRATRNRVYGNPVSRVQIPLSPPELTRQMWRVFFILQNLYFLKYNEFIGTKAGLMMQLRGKDREVLKHAIELDNATEYAFNESFELLFSWCQETLHSL